MTIRRQNSFFGNELNLLKFSSPSPCMENGTKYQSCESYCKWHDAYFKDLAKEEFITLMKYAVPQRKAILPSTQLEHDMAKRMFDTGLTGKMNDTFAPFALILFCYTRTKGLVGEDIGLFAKVCNDFFPTPTDQGICLTQNMDINEVMKTGKEYETLFEPNLQKPPESVKGGTDGSKHTMVFFTGVGKNSYKFSYLMDQMNIRDLKIDTGDVILKFHQGNQIAHMIKDTGYLTSSSLTLKSGYEYVIEVKPKIIETTPAFKRMNIEQRKCKLHHEIEENSLFNVYTQQNCKYECYIKEAESHCKCIPWDFMHQNAQAKECDVFGRTCFFNVLENTSKSIDLCRDCVKECDYVTYDGIVIKESKVTPIEIIGDGSTYNYYCEGEQALCDYFWPDEGTNFIDKGLRNAYSAFYRGELSIVCHL